MSAAAPAPPTYLSAPTYNGDDSDLNVSFRRLGKKDGVTKVKALLELQAGFPSRSKDALKAVLPFWSYAFPRLCLDADRRVREATFHAFATLVFCITETVEF